MHWTAPWGPCRKSHLDTEDVASVDTFFFQGDCQFFTNADRKYIIPHCTTEQINVWGKHSSVTMFNKILALCVLYNSCVITLLRCMFFQHWILLTWLPFKFIFNPIDTKQMKKKNDSNPLRELKWTKCLFVPSLLSQCPQDIGQEYGTTSPYQV